MKKFFALVLGVALLAANCMGCSGGAEKAGSEDGLKPLTLGVIDGSLAGEIIWVAQEEGLFEKHGVDITIQTFTNGMVMLEALDTMDVALTGIGGILAGTINYDAQIFSVIAPDSGTQMLWVRPDSDIVAAGQGHNTISPEIYGDAESWRGADILSTSGNVLQYLLMNVLGGFDLTLEDVNVMWMDMPTCNASFLAGEGDAATLTGSVCYAEDKSDYVIAATGPMCDLGLTTCMLASRDKIADPGYKASMAAYLTACFEAVEWIKANPEKAEEYMIEWCEYCGQPCTPELAHVYLQADPHYTFDETYEMMNAKAENGEDYSAVEEKLLSILDFYIDCGNYLETDREKFLNDHFTLDIIQEVKKNR